MNIFYLIFRGVVIGLVLLFKLLNNWLSKECSWVILFGEKLFSGIVLNWCVWGMILVIRFVFLEVSEIFMVCVLLLMCICWINFFFFNFVRMCDIVYNFIVVNLVSWLMWMLFCWLRVVMRCYIIILILYFFSNLLNCEVMIDFVWFRRNGVNWFKLKWFCFIMFWFIVIIL